MNELIKRFAEQMQIELEKNYHKGDIFKWKGIQDKLLDLEYHKAKLLLAIKEKNNHAIKEFLADSANILLAIGNELDLYAEDSRNDGIASQMKFGVFDLVEVEKQANRKLL